jgi:methanogenic corrinoid protein MtbC1
MLAGFSDALEQALLTPDQDEAERVTRDALSVGLPAALIDDHIVRPAMRSIGERWARGEITPVDERRATAIVLRLLTVVRDVGRVEQERLETTALFCAPEGEQHVVGLLMAADLLDDAGYNVVLAGADVASDSLSELLDQHRPQLLGLTGTMPHAAPSLRASVAAAHRAGITGVMVGGAIAGQTLDPTPSVRTLDGVAGVVNVADGLLRRAGVN